MATVYIGLGSNRNDPPRQLRNAVDALMQLPHSRYLADSGMYRSRAHTLANAEAQADYTNAVAVIETDLQPHALLDALQAIESRQGRVRTGRWKPRTLDLDILLYGDRVVHDERLQVPHPEMHRREFVLYPLQRVAPELDIPGHGKLKQMIERCPLNGLQYLGSISNKNESGDHERDPK